MNPAHYARWIKSQTELFVENQDFIVLVIDNESLKGTLGGGANKTAHLITFDMTKHKLGSYRPIGQEKTT